MWRRASTLRSVRSARTAIWPVKAEARHDEVRGIAAVCGAEHGEAEGMAGGPISRRSILLGDPDRSGSVSATTRLVAAIGIDGAGDERVLAVALEARRETPQRSRRRWPTWS